MAVASKVEAIVSVDAVRCGPILCAALRRLYERLQYWLVVGLLAVLYLNDDFEGGATHYLPGQGSEVGQAIAVRPCRGCAVVHRGVSVLHCGGRVLSGTKYIMQFSLMYEAPHGDAGRDLTQPLRWGA